ncbi:T9SS type A sorting domain-containing protein, partial [bacterium]|nr:T9SS type A sorting domain-containing protein [bacterium]
TLWHGSVIYNEYGYPDLTACTFAGNHVSNGQPYENTGVVHNHISKPTMTGSTVWENTSPYYLPGELVESKAYYTTYSCIEEGFDGTGNIDVDPLFLSFGPEPFSTAPWSPCANAGPADTTGLRLPPLDLASSSRILEGRIDIGCYEPATGTEVPGAAAPLLALHPPFPNPARGGCALAFSIEAAADIALDIYDVAGRHVRTLRAGRAESGHHTVKWDGRGRSGAEVAAGVYFVRLSTDGFEDAVEKIVLLR